LPFGEVMGTAVVVPRVRKSWVIVICLTAKSVDSGDGRLSRNAIISPIAVWSPCDTTFHADVRETA
jgi:hypothetical protein